MAGISGLTLNPYILGVFFIQKINTRFEPGRLLLLSLFFGCVVFFLSLLKNHHITSKNQDFFKTLCIFFSTIFHNNLRWVSS